MRPTKQFITLKGKQVEVELTEQQKKFAEYGVFLTGLDWIKAVELAEYKFGEENYKENYDHKGEHYLDMLKRKKVRENLSNNNILKYISSLREELDNQLVVDKLWVTNKLKILADNGSEKTQIEATKLLGQTLNMFQSDVQISVNDSPAKIAQDAFKKRMEQEKSTTINVIPFSKEGSNE
jgi:hypothetical protein